MGSKNEMFSKDHFGPDENAIVRLISMARELNEKLLATRKTLCLSEAKLIIAVEALKDVEMSPRILNAHELPANMQAIAQRALNEIGQK